MSKKEYVRLTQNDSEGPTLRKQGSLEDAQNHTISPDFGGGSLHLETASARST
jgi:hypothetical protein